MPDIVHSHGGIPLPPPQPLNGIAYTDFFIRKRRLSFSKAAVYLRVSIKHEETLPKRGFFLIAAWQ